MPIIIDAEVHISPTNQGGNSITMDEPLCRMDRSGADKASTWLQPPYVRSEIDAGNAYVVRAMRDHPDRILGFGWADPNLGVERAVADATRANDNGCYGVKLNGAQNGYPIDDPRLVMPVIEEVARAGSVLALRVGAHAPDFTHPSRVAPIGRAFPELRILVVHTGGAAFHDLSAHARSRRAPLHAPKARRGGTCRAGHPDPLRDPGPGHHDGPGRPLRRWRTPSAPTRRGATSSPAPCTGGASR